MTDARYPIGKFDWSAPVTARVVVDAIDELSRRPAELRRAVDGLSDEQLDTPYREGGWTLRQVVHHLPDSHLNGYVRCKLALTEDNPTIRPYHEDRWAALGDSRDTPLEVSLSLLTNLHARWVALVRGLSERDLDRTFRHPEAAIDIPLRQHLAHYAWHGRHHTAQITATVEREGWRSPR